VPAPKYNFRIDSVIDAMEQAYPEDRPSAICYVWKWYGGHTLHRQPGLQLQNFKYSRINSTVKSMVRLSDVKTMRPLHYPICKKRSFFVNSALQRVETSAISKSPANVDGGWVNHYWNKSFEEFCVKRARGDSLDMDSKRNDYKRTDQQYFAWNVPAIAENFDPTSESILARVTSEYEQLLLLAGVRDLNEHIAATFPQFLSSLIDDSELKRRFAEVAARHPILRFQDA
jgi:hypothetical protein